MEAQRLTETRTYYEEFPFIEGGSKRIDWWQEYLKPFLPDDLVRGRLIGDIGSSVGEISRGLANRGARMVCLDLTLAALKRNREINPEAELFHGTALNLPFADETFDHTISIGVLMVTPDCRKGIKEVARVTAPGGTIVLFIYNYWSYLNLLYHLFKPVTKVVPLHSVPSGIVRLMQPFVKGHLGIELDEPLLRRLLGDKLWTPHATFHTLGQMKKWGAEEGLTMTQWKRFYHNYANVMAFKKEGTARSTPTEELGLRCVRCGHSPLSNSQETYNCDQCLTTFDKLEGINRFLPDDVSLKD
jgi:SAM-dependent methyltransferase